MFFYERLFLSALKRFLEYIAFREHENERVLQLSKAMASVIASSSIKGELQKK